MHRDRTPGTEPMVRGIHVVRTEHESLVQADCSRARAHLAGRTQVTTR